MGSRCQPWTVCLNPLKSLFVIAWEVIKYPYGPTSSGCKTAAQRPRDLTRSAWIIKCCAHVSASNTIYIRFNSLHAQPMLSLLLTRCPKTNTAVPLIVGLQFSRGLRSPRGIRPSGLFVDTGVVTEDLDLSPSDSTTMSSADLCPVTALFGLPKSLMVLVWRTFPNTNNAIDGVCGTAHRVAAGLGPSLTSPDSIRLATC